MHKRTDINGEPDEWTQEWMDLEWEEVSHVLRDPPPVCTNPYLLRRIEMLREHGHGGAQTYPTRWTRRWLRSEKRAFEKGWRDELAAKNAREAKRHDSATAVVLRLLEARHKKATAEKEGGKVGFEGVSVKF